MKYVALLLTATGLSFSIYHISPLIVNAFQNYRDKWTSKSFLKAQHLFEAHKNIKLQFYKTVSISILTAILFGIIFESFFFALIGALLVFLLPTLTEKQKKRKRLLLLNKQLPEVAQRMADAVKAGSGLKEAIQEAAIRCGPPFSLEMAHALRETDLGLPLIKALNKMAQRISSPEYLVFCTSISIAQETGGSLSTTLDSFAKGIIERRVVEGRVKALTAQGKMQGLIIALLPIIMGGIIYLLDPNMIRPLYSTTVGQLLLLSALVLEIAGALSIRKLIMVKV